MGLRTVALLAALVAAVSLAALSLVALPAVSAAAGAAPVNTTAPLISYPAGTPPVVGDTLAVSTGTWSNAPTSFSYQWSAGSTPITGATQATYTISAADLGTSGEVRYSVVVTAANASGATPAVASSQAVIVGAQHGDVIVTGDGVHPGFSYNARPIPPACVNYFNPPGDPDPFCAQVPYSAFFSIDSANANGAVTLTDTVAGSTGLEFSFYAPAGNQNSAQAYFTATSHGYQYPGAFFGGQSVGQLGLTVLDCNAGAPCTVNFDLRDVYGEFEGGSYVVINVRTLTANGPAGGGYVYIPLTPTAPPPTAGFTWNGGGSNSFNFVSTSAATSPATIVGYSWDFGDGTTSTAGPNVTHTYTAQAPSRQVSLTVTDSNGAQATSTQTMGPDLVVSDAVSNPPSPDPGQAASMAVTVRNDGPATVTAVAPTVIFTDPAVTVGSPSPASADVGPGDSTTFNVSYSAPSPGKIQAQVQAAGSTGGSTVTSTPVTRTIAVGVAVTATLTPSTTNPVAGTPFTLDLHIANNSGHAQGFALGAPTANPPSGVTVTAPTSPPANLADGQSEDLTYSAVVSQAGPVTVTTPVVATDLTTLATAQLGPQTDLTVAAPLTVVSSTSGSDHGPITGGYPMTITGTGLTGTTAVAFFVGGAQVKTVSIPTSTSDTTIGLTAPDLAALVGSIPAGSDTLSVDVVVAKPGPGPTGSVVLGNGPFSFNLPAISSVTATATGNSHGSIVGGYQLTITGADLTGVEAAGFYLAQFPVKTLPMAPSTSDTTIVVTAPDLSALVGSLPAGSNRLTVDVVAATSDANAPGGVVVSHYSPFGFDTPAIATVTVTATGSTHGSIIGGYQLTIEGKDLTGVDTVIVGLAGSPVSTIAIPPSTSDTTIQLTAPDLASLVGSIPAGSDTLPVDVAAQITDANAPGGGVVSYASPFDFNLPSISSVTVTATGNSHGSIVGGYQLTITGADLTGVEAVGFYLAQFPVKSLPIAPSTSDTTIVVTAPDLSALVGSVPAGSNVLTIDVVVGIADANAPGGVVVSHDSPFGFDIPAIATVTATATGGTHGSIIGGYQLTIEGKDLTGIDTVILALDGARVKTIAITPSTSDTTIQVTAPDLSSLAGSIPAGSTTLPVDVIVQTNDANAPAGVIASNQVPFDFNVPTVSSVTATDTGAAHGGIAGGYHLTITGADLTGVDQVTFTPPTNNLPTVGTLVVDLPSPSTSDTTIVVTAPDESALAPLITSGSHSLPIGVKVAITDGTGPGGSVLFETPPTTFDFDVPAVSSVTATATGATHGGIVGGYQLTVTGSDLGGVTQVAFLDGADQVKTITLAGPSASNTTIQVTAPDLSALINSIPAGGHSLPIGVAVAIADGSNPGGPPLYQSPPTTFDFNVPAVTSVTATATGAPHGSIVGGYQLTITGSDLAGVDQVEFDPPANNLPSVSNLVIDLPAPSTSDTTIVVTAPDESKLASLVTPGSGSLPVGVRVAISDGSGPGASLVFQSPPTTFSFNLPNFTSVIAVTTGANRGAFTGGYHVTITGTDLTGVTALQFLDGSAVVKTVALAGPSASDTTITMLVPDLATLVGSLAPGSTSLPLSVVGVLPEPSDPALTLSGGSADFSLTAPTLASVVSVADGVATTPITGGDGLNLTGSGLVGVDTAAFFLGGDRVKTVSIPVSNVDGGAEVLATPDLASLVDSIPAGSSTLNIEIELAIADPLAPGGFVESNPIPIGFVLPRIDSLSASTTGAAHGSLSGGYTVTARGHDLGHVTTVAFDYATESVAGVTVSSGGGGSPGSDTTVTFTAPNLSSLLDSLPSGATSLPVDVSFGGPDPAAPASGVFSLPVAFGLDLVAADCGALVDCVGGVNTDPKGTATASSSSGTGTISATGSGVGAVTVGRYTSDPVGTAAFEIAGSYFDVRSSTPEAFSSVTIVNCDLAGGTAIHWWNPTGGSAGAGAWAAVSNQSYSAGPPACVTVTIGSATSPSLAELTGTVFVASTPTATPAANTGTGTGNGAGTGSGTPATPASGGTLAFTGGDVRRLFELSVVLVVSGAFLTRRARRPRPAHRALRRRR
ncbi:MAG: IPT/TIG domain-containing protein [Acidobacteriota bacterium]|nr:IPT/TIG domain-containing protein [Acidobacteriota bacterium]